MQILEIIGGSRSLWDSTDSGEGVPESDLKEMVR
jgi:hypothetical protein